MSYPIQTKNYIDMSLSGARASGEGMISYEHGLEIADKVGEYLKEKNAALLVGPGEVSSLSIKICNNAGDWVYHLRNTTLYSEIRPVQVGCSDVCMSIIFAAEGKKSKEILRDLQSILDGY